MDFEYLPTPTTIAEHPTRRRVLIGGQRRWAKIEEDAGRFIGSVFLAPGYVWVSRSRQRDVWPALKKAVNNLKEINPKETKSS